jgi:perosamine synthetase
MKVPLARPDVSEADIEAVVAVLRSPNLSQGPILHEFERSLADYLDMSDAIVVNSGTSALQLALRALNVGDGDEVILPSFSFMAVTNAILAEKAIPVFMDIDPLTCNMDPSKLESIVTGRAKAIIIVNSFGFPAASGEIVEFAKRHSLSVIDDACEALGTAFDNRKAGTFGDIGIFAFYPNKLITTGEGGALVTNSAGLSARIRSLRNQGRQAGDWFQHVEPGFSFRLSDINCALGLQQLRRIEQTLCRREKLAKDYEERLCRNPNLSCFRFPRSEFRISWFTYPVLLQKKFSRKDRDRIWRELQKSEIECGRYFAPSHLQPAVSQVPYRTGDLTQTIQLSERLLCLPLYNSLSGDQIEYVCDSLNEAVSAPSRDDDHSDVS